MDKERIARNKCEKMEGEIEEREEIGDRRDRHLFNQRTLISYHSRTGSAKIGYTW